MTLTQYPLVGVLLVFHAAHGHYTFVRLAVNDEWLEPMRYIRNKTTPYLELPRTDTNYHYRAFNDPTYAGTDRSESVRCGRDHMAHAAVTEVLRVRGGDEIELAQQRYEPAWWRREHFENCPGGYGTCEPGRVMGFNHWGPLMVHLSKVPDGEDVHEYDGSGEWVKIFTLGVEVREDDPAHWILFNRGKLPPRFSFTIPRQTPPGQYLMRMDHTYIGFRDVIGDKIFHVETQLYPSCAQIEVVVINDGVASTLPKGIKILEDIIDGERGMKHGSLSMYRQQQIDSGYHYPGGLLWDREAPVQDVPDRTIKPALSPVDG